MQQDVIELFESNIDHAETYQDRFDHVQEGQQPEVVTVCCSDSRVLQDHMWGNDHPGKIFTAGNIGNRVFQKTRDGRTVSGDVLYPVEHTETSTIVVVGHSGCGAVTATYRDITEGLDEPAGIRHCIDLLRPYLKDGIEELEADGSEYSENEAVDRLVEYNVDRQVAFLQQSDDIPDSVDVIGAVYDFMDVYSGNRGEVHIININGERDPATLRDKHPRLADRIERVWDR
ncbi:MAG: carbonic anhydrase [Candidatus Nanohaloarchaea archaeon]|nr:carbonic anhydrase [Candidatus Nanohaloarchaea archaeon]